MDVVNCLVLQCVCGPPPPVAGSGVGSSLSPSVVCGAGCLRSRCDHSQATFPWMTLGPISEVRKLCEKTIQSQDVH